jgi:hypothetical protein
MEIKIKLTLLEKCKFDLPLNVVDKNDVIIGMVTGMDGNILSVNIKPELMDAIRSGQWTGITIGCINDDIVGLGEIINKTNDSKAFQSESRT